MRLPQAVRIADAHLQNASVAIDVLDGQSLDRILFVGIGTRARTHPLRFLGERPLGAVRVDARTDVERPCVERAGDLGIGAITRRELINEVQHRGRCRHLGRMNVAVDPEGRLFDGRTACDIGRGGEPDVSSFVALSYRFEGDEPRIFRGKGFEGVSQLGVTIKVVETNGRHGRRERKQSAECGWERRGQSTCEGEQAQGSAPLWLENGDTRQGKSQSH